MEAVNDALKLISKAQAKVKTFEDIDLKEIEVIDLKEIKDLLQEAIDKLSQRST